ncbi:hypothetical protein HS7_14230 [Sulfolobales archaeon HS-7]|nr:hypothetical protein HS7_14230 [Sulfolobales archaeon HS-7]
MAIDIAKKLYQVKRKCGDEGIKGFTRRARDFPSLMLQGGLVGAMIFYLSKGKISDIGYYYDYWRAESPRVEDKKICSDMEGESNKGYSAFIGSLFYILNSMEVESCGGDEIREDLILECIRSIEEREVKIEKKILTPIIRVKELSEMLTPQGDTNE